MQEITYQGADGEEKIERELYSADTQRDLVRQMDSRMRELESQGNTIKSVRRKKIEPRYISAVRAASEQMGVTLTDDQALVMALDLQKKEGHTKVVDKKIADQRRKAKTKKRRKAQSAARRRTQR